MNAVKSALILLAVSYLCFRLCRLFYNIEE